MKQITIAVYGVSELPEEVRERLLDKHRDINVSDSWWHEDLIEEERVELESRGITIDEKKTYFDCQERYLYSEHVSADLDNRELLKELASCGEWKRFAEARSIAALIGNNVTTTNCVWIENIEWSKHCLNITLEYDEEQMLELFRSCNENPELAEIQEMIDGMAGELEEYLKDRANALLKRIDDEYDYQTSDEAVTETLDANSYTFTKDGTPIRTEESE